MRAPTSRFRHALTLLASACAIVLASSPSSAAPADWTFTKVIDIGQNGFTSISATKISNNGTVVVLAKRNGVTGYFRLSPTEATPLLLIGDTLPGSTDVVKGLSAEFLVDQNGRLIFFAGVATPPSNSTFTHTYRLSAGVIENLDALGSPNDLKLITSDGRWLSKVSGASDNGSVPITYTLVGGTAPDVVASVTIFRTSCVIDDSLPLFNAAGQFLFSRRVTNSCLLITTDTSDLRLVAAGGSPVTIAEGSFVRTMSSLEGSPTGAVIASRVGTHVGFQETDGGFAAINDAGSVFFTRDVFAASAPIFTRKLMIRDAVGEREIASFLPATGVRTPFEGLGFDNAGRVAFMIQTTNTTTGTLFAGPDLVNDTVLLTGGTLFGQTVTSFTAQVNSPTDVVGDKRTFLIRYRLLDGTTGYAIASKQLTRWTNSAGGPWTTATNWAPAVVPGAGIATVFDLENSYDVTVGTQSTGSAAIQNGSVGFRSANLTLIGAVTIGGDAVFTQPEGKITAGELTIGSLPPVNPANEPTARFNLSNQGTEFITTGPALIGNAGLADLFISDAKMTNGEVRIGAGSKGTATVGSPNALWTTGNLAVGFSHEATLNIERGARMLSTNAFIGLGGELLTNLASVIVDNAGSATGPDNWTISGDLQIGNFLPGRLTIKNGGVVNVLNNLQTAFKVHGDIVEAAIDVTGTRGTAARPSSLVVFNNMLLGQVAGSTSTLTISDGGSVEVGTKISLSALAQSLSKITVTGVNANGARSQLKQGNIPGDRFAVGLKNRGVLVIRDGGVVNSREMRIGNDAGSSGEVLIDGVKSGFAASLNVTDTLVVGGATLGGTTAGVSGILTVQNGGQVNTATLIVGTAGRVRGSGTIVVGTTLSIEGVIEPGVGFETALEPLAPSGGGGEEGGARGEILAATAPVLPGTLTIQGNVVLGATGKIELDVNGSTASGAADKLVVTGALTLGGTVVLNFTNGYAPRAGDTLDFVSATSVSGAFATTTITGLAPGFSFSVAPNGSGGVRLTALNNAVAATAIGSRLANLSVRTPLASAQNLIVGFVVQGGAKSMLVRAAGPGLAQFLAGTHPDPRITLFNGAGVSVDANDNWPGALTPTMQALSAFPFASGSNDAALQRSVDGSHTAHVNGPGAGIVLVELYDAAAGVSPRLVNVSARNKVGVGDGVLIAGFIIEGTSPKTVLVRAIGPTLAVFGVTGVLADPQLALFDSTSVQLAQNDNWPDALATTFAAVQAFPLTSGTKDAAFVVTLAPGAYTAQVSGVGSTIGEALVEIYEVP